jgi:hypothetical protein
MINRLILKFIAPRRISGRVKSLSLSAALYIHAGLLLALGLTFSSFAAEKNEARPLGIAAVDTYRAGAEQLAFRIAFTGKPDPARLRILVDVDGHDHGEPNSGADYMLEGTSFYRYPEGGKGWQWTVIDPPLVITKSNQVVCLLPKAFHAVSVHWIVEITDQSWATVDRFPKEGQAELKLQDLPILPDEELARQVTAPGLKIINVVPLRVPGGGLAFRVSFAGLPDPSRFRLMLDTDQPHTREPNAGADYMLEGVSFYNYPAGGSNWTWNAMAPPVVIADGNTLTYVLLDAPPSSSIKWVAETTNPDWSSADRFPTIGKSEFTLPALPELKLDVRHRPEDISELTNGGPTLSCRFDKEIGAQQWEVIPVHTPIWEVNQIQTSFPIRITLTDVVSGQTAVAEPTHAFRAGDTLRWVGTTLGVNWTLVATPDGGGDLWLSGELRSDTNRCIRMGVGCSLNPITWTWHDDTRTSRPMMASLDPYGNVAASPCGLRGEQSLYPFGVISSSHGSLVVETDPDEPRVYQVFAETDKQFFGVYYDLALSPKTMKFPGEATFRCALRSLPASDTNAFRRTLAAFYKRNPAFFQRRTPAVGLWMPFFDISTIPHAEDFGFAFFEKEGGAGKDVDSCATNGILTLAYTEPWLFWLPMPGKDRTEAEAIRRMKLYAAAGNDQRSEFAAAALSGAVRKTDDSIQMSFIDVPWNSGARMEVSTDPELPTSPESPINRAMSEWRHAKQVLDDKRIDGVYLDSMSAMDSVDYNPVAIAVADYPCTYEAGVFRPGLSTKIASYEYTAGLGRALQRRGKYLMGNFPCWRFPFYMKYIDIPGEETTWLLGGKYQRLDDQQLAYRRAISGQKPYGFLQAANFDQFKGPILEQYFQDCMFWGFLPSFFSADGANNPYWTKPEWYERDRPFFRTYLPIIRRLAAAGWQPLGPAQTDSESVWVENFGNIDSAICHITLRNLRDTGVTTRLSLGDLKEPTALINPLDGRCDILESSSKVELTIPGSAIETRDIVPISHLNEEMDFVRHWNPGGGEAKACAKTLASLQTELAANIHCTLTVPSPLVLGEDNRVALEINNHSERDITISGLRATRGARLTPINEGSQKVPSGKSAVISGLLRAESNTWIEIQWQLDRGATNFVCVRDFKPRLVAPLTVSCPVDKMVVVGEETSLELTLENIAIRTRDVRIQWQGNFGSGERKESVAAQSVQTSQLPVKAGTSKRGTLSVTVESDGATIFQRRFGVTFLASGENLARDSRMRVEADSTYSGYSTKALTDGVRDTTGVAWNEAAWASDETGGPHWVRITFPEPTTVRALSIYWNIEGGVTYTSQHGSVIGYTESGEKVVLGEFTNQKPVPMTSTEFALQKLKAIELLQPARGGSEARPNLMWLSEVEVH